MKKTIKAWAVIDWDMWKKDKHLMSKVFNPHMQNFSEAIFIFKEDAEKYSEKLNQWSRTIIVPVSLSYEIPDLKRYKKSV